MPGKTFKMFPSPNAKLIENPKSQKQILMNKRLKAAGEYAKVKEKEIDPVEIGKEIISEQLQRLKKKSTMQLLSVAEATIVVNLVKAGLALNEANPKEQDKVSGNELENAIKLLNQEKNERESIAEDIKTPKEE